MRFTTGLATLALAGAVSLLSVGMADAQYLDGQLHIHGFFRLSGALHYGAMNPNNTFVQKKNNDWNQFRPWGQVSFEVEPKDQDFFSFFAKVNYAGEFASKIDDNLFDFAAFPSFENDVGIEDDNNQLRLWEIYADFRPGPFWLRIGRQTIAWGDTIAFRTNDIVNPLDLTWHPVGEPWFEEFRYQREPQWMVKAAYNFPSQSVPDLELEVIVNPNFIPVQLPAGGSPYSVIPFGTREGLPFTTPDGAPFLQFIEEDPDGVEAGARLKGTFGRWSLQWTYYNGFNDAGIAQTRGIRIDPRGVDFGFGPFVVEVDNLHPRANNIGFTMNTYFQGIDSVLNLEARLTPDQPYEHTDFAAGLNPGDLPFVRRATLVYSVGLDKNIQIPALNYGRSFNMGFQVQHTVILDDTDLDNITIAGSPVKRNTFLINYTVRTGYMNDNIQPFFLLLWDPEGAAWFSPYVQFIYGDHLRFWIGVNHFVADDDTRFDAARGFPVGVFDFQDEVFFRASVEF